MGTLGSELGTTDPKGLRDLLQGKLADITRKKVKETLLVHGTGLNYLPGSIRPKDGLLLNNLTPFEALVNRMGYLGKYLVLDFGPGISPLVQKLLPACDAVVALVEPIINSIALSKAFLADLEELGFSGRKVLSVIVDQGRSADILTAAQVEAALGNPLVAAIIPAPDLFQLAAYMKTTITGADPESLTTQQFSKLTEAVLELEKGLAK
jgi:MinD-like ATPase involved in chromosome partitioning or flagellar assembly